MDPTSTLTTRQPSESPQPSQDPARAPGNVPGRVGWGDAIDRAARTVAGQDGTTRPFNSGAGTGSSLPPPSPATLAAVLGAAADRQEPQGQATLSLKGPIPRSDRTSIVGETDRARGGSDVKGQISHFDPKQRAFFLEWNNNDRGFETKVPLEGPITGPFFKGLEKWKSEHAELKATDKERYIRDGVREVHRLQIECAGEYHEETAQVINEKIRPLQEKAGVQSELVTAAEKNIAHYEKLQRYSAIAKPMGMGVHLKEDPQFTGIAMIPTCTDEWSRSGDPLTQKLHAKLGPFAHEQAVKDAKRYLADFDVTPPTEISMGHGSKSNQEDMLIKFVAKNASERMSALKDGYEKALVQKPLLEEQVKKMLAEAAAIPLPQIPGEGGPGPVDVNKVGKGNLVCRHRAPMTSAGMTFIGIENEILLASMLQGRTAMGHVTTYLPELHSVYEPSSDRLMISKVVGRWDGHASAQHKHALATASGTGYGQEYADSNLPDLGPQGALSPIQDVRRDARNQFRLQSIVNGNAARTESIFHYDLYDVASKVQRYDQYFNHGEDHWAREADLFKTMSSSEITRWNENKEIVNLETAKLLRDADGPKQRGNFFAQVKSYQAFETATAAASKDNEALARTAHERMAGPDFERSIDALFRARGILPDSLTSKQRYALASYEAGLVMDELAKEDPSHSYRYRPQQQSEQVMGTGSSLGAKNDPVRVVHNGR